MSSPIKFRKLNALPGVIEPNFVYFVFSPGSLGFKIYAANNVADTLHEIAPEVPTAAPGTNTNQTASTAFVQTALGDVEAVLIAINGIAP